MVCFGTRGMAAVYGQLPSDAQQQATIPIRQWIDKGLAKN